MKNQIDQSTPFLAFYDLLRIRGIYSDEEKREKLRRGFRRAMALAATLVAFALPQSAWARPRMSGPLPAGVSLSADEKTMTISSGSSFTWDEGFNIAGDEKVDITAGNTVHRDTSGNGSSIAGTLDAHGASFWILNPKGISVSTGAHIDNVSGFLAAAMDGFSWGKSYGVGSDVVKGNVDLGNKTGSSYTVAIGQSVDGASGATVVATKGMVAGSTFSIAAEGGTITFAGDVGSGVLKAGTINFENGSNVGVEGGGDTDGSVIASGGTINVINAGSTVYDDDGNLTSFTQIDTAKLTQKSGTIDAATKIAGALAQTAGTATGSVTGDATVGGTLNAASVGGKATVSGTLNGVSGSGLSVGSLEQTGGTIAANGTLTIGDGGESSQTGGTITATGTSLNAGTQNVSLNQADNTLGTVSGEAGNITLNGASLTVSGLSASGTLELQANASAAGNVTAAKIDAGTHTFTQNGAGTITVSGSDGIVASTITQTADAGTIEASKLAGDVTQNGGTISGAAANGDVEITGVLDQNVGEIALGTGTLTLGANSTAAGNVTAGKIAAGTHTFTQDGAGTITVSGADGIVASTITQTADAGTISASKLDGSVTQNRGKIAGYNGGGLELTQSLAAQSGEIDVSGGTLTLTGDNTLSGTVSAKNLTAGTGKITQSAGTITVGETLTAGTFTQGGVAATTASAATIAANVEQTGGGTITATTAIGADGNAKTVAQSGTGLIKTDHVYGTVSQTGSGAARLQANTASGTLVLEGDVTQNNANATIGTTSTGVTVKQAFTQNQNKGKVEANTLTLDNSAKDKVYDFYGEGNQIATITGTAGSVGINNGEHDLTLKNLSTSADIAVTGAKDVTLDGVSSGGKVRVLSATGKVSDTSAQGAVTLELGRRDAGSDVRTVGSVNLVNGTGAITIQGVNAAGNVVIANNAVTLANSGGGAESKGNIYADGNVGITTAALTQNGKEISGKNVTILGTGNLTTGAGKFTATDGDILVKSATGKVTTGATEISASKNVVIQGKSVETAGTTIKAATAGKGIGIQATDGNATVKSGTTITAPTVVLDASGDAVVETGVAMNKSDAEDDAKKADLFAAAGGKVDVKLSNANKPTDSVTIVSGSLAEVPNEETTVELASFGYKTDGDIGFKFAGSKLAVESTGGNVNITAVKRDGETDGNVHGLTIVDMSTSVGGASVSAENVVDANDNPVEIKVGSDIASVQPKGLVAAAEGKSVTLDASAIGDVTVEGVITSANAPTITMAAGKSFTVKQGATVQSLNGAVSLATTGAGAIDVQSGGTVQAANGAVTLATEGGAIAVAGTVQAAGGAVEIKSGDALTVSGTVRDSMTTFVDEQELSISAGGGIKLSTTGTGDAAKDVTVSGTANALGTVEIDSAKDVVLSGTVSSGDDAPEAEAPGSVTIVAAKGISQTGGLVATRGEGGTLEFTATDGNINQTGGAVAAMGDATAKAENGSVVLAQAGNDFSALDVTAKGDVNVRDHDANADGFTVKVTGKADGGRTGAVTLQGDGVLTVDSPIDANGAATLTGASVTTSGAVKANGANSDVAVTATGGAAQLGGAVTAGRDAAIDATAGANTTAGAVEAGRNATIDAGTGEAQVAAVTATAGNAAVIGGAGATVGGNLTAGGNAVVVSDGGAATVNGNIQAANVGLQGATVANNGTVAQGVNQLAIVQTGGAEMTLTDETIPTGAQTVGIRSAGNLTVTSDHDLVFGNASVSAGDRTVAANGLASTAGTVEATTAGNIASSAITGAAGTTVTTENGGAINVAGNLGQGGDTVVNANGAAVTAGALASGDLLDVNNAGAVNANIAAGGAAQIQAASLQAGNTAAGGNLTFDTVTGPANVGNLAVGGDVNGTVNGLFTTAGGQVGSIGQQGGFNAPGGATVDGNLNSGPVLATTGAFTVNGALNAGGNAVVLNTAATTLNGGLTGGNVTINAGGPVTGGGALAAGQLNIAAGGNVITLPNVQSANLNQITGGNITLTDTTGQQITIGTINAGGVLDLTLNSAAGTVGGGNLTANGTMTLTVNGPFGDITAPVNITINGGNPVLNIDGSGIDGSLLHFILNGELNPGDILVNYLGEGFAIYGSQQAGWQIIGIGPEKQRLLNRALAFSVNTPELKSKQGIFGDPAMLHTRMNVSEARPGANMDMLALKSVDFSETWKDVSESGGDLAEWTPAVYVDEAPLLPKLEALASEVQLQPEIQPYHGSTGNADAKE